MKKITNSLMPLSALALFGTCLVTVFGLLVVLMTSVGLANGEPLSYYQRLNIPIISVALPIVGMILFAAILLGLPSRPADAVESTATERDLYPSMNEEEKKHKRRLKAAA
jgi:uncharacterized protein YacL